MSKEIIVPDIGTTGEVTVIEISVKVGDKIAVDQSIVTLESEKASMEVPSSDAGVVEAILVKVGDKVKMGSSLLKLKGEGAEAQKTPDTKKVDATKPAEKVEKTVKVEPIETAVKIGDIYASPGVRRLSAELNIDLSRIRGTGLKNRIQKEDLLNYIKSAMTQGGGGNTGSGLPKAPVVDFAQFGPVETKALTKIKKLTAVNLHRNWVLIPHVTQFEEADITEMDVFRKSQQERLEKDNIKLTPLIFIMKAVVACLKTFPQFNASLDPTGENLILKKYFHIGVAVDTPEGLVVPVIRDVDKKGLLDLAKELSEISNKARNKQLLPKDMQGSCFTISSLGGIGGTAFTPIVNMPDVAILGVSKAQIKPIYQNGEFVPRLMLPLSLSYDHRVIDGAEGARFIVQLSKYLTDFRLVLM
ncbi:MAG TPA: dihydrolipoyllysine-residue acetyltransferase [Gammaproteobacteria bacterium]|nr:dihydrolipoyllysine-residue acetyltransferase [Gammaproteobacteria bacterium]